MSAAELKKQLKEMRPTFSSAEEEIAYHTAAKKSLAAKERMAAVRAAKTQNKVEKAPEAKASVKVSPVKEVKEVKAKKEKVAKEATATKAKEPEVISAKKAALLAQLEALGS